ncbi:hypothetical protein CEXT_525651 [Caerostris extrusa]|uniref:Uncharacterized protein n=1 Tax=Caerostris extrusa TaxID=172846 RepID=A0AAV4MQP0_CAEEX|nr:hypothetical protein CEXT_525651 [Caerostris extrusa]
MYMHDDPTDNDGDESGIHWVFSSKFSLRISESSLAGFLIPIYSIIPPSTFLSIKSGSRITTRPSLPDNPSLLNSPT